MDTDPQPDPSAPQPQRKPPPKQPPAQAPTRRKKAIRRKPQLEAGRVLSRTFGLTGKHFPQYLGIAALSFLPWIAFEYWSIQRVVDRDVGRIMDVFAVDKAGVEGLLSEYVPDRTKGMALLGQLLNGIGLMFLTGAVTYMVVQDLRGGRASAGRALSISGNRLISMIGISIMIGLMAYLFTILLGLLPAFILGGMFESAEAALIARGVVALIVYAMLYTRFCCAIPVTIVEELSATKSMSRSELLTKGVRWIILGAGLLIVILPAAAAVVSDLKWMNLASWKTAIIANALVAIVSGVLIAVFCAIVYHDTRTSSEGIDTTQIAQVFD